MPSAFAREVLKQGGILEVYRLDPLKDAQPNRSFGAVGRAIVRKVTLPRPSWEADVIALLASERSYRVLRGPDDQKRCDLKEGVGLRFLSGSRTIDVSLCFECCMLAVYSKDPPISEGGDFDPSNARLTALVKEAFPDDPEIQGLDGKPCISPPPR